jgi:hypothetical protein
MLAAVDGVAAPLPSRPGDVATAAASAGPHTRSLSQIPPLITWLVLQGAALALAAARVPLSAHYPQAGERLAIDLVLAAQIGGAAALFPMLMRDRRTAAVTTSATWPFIAFAALLAALPMGRSMLVGAFVTAWLVVLGLWNAGLRSSKWRAIASAVAVLVTIGGALLWYLRVEFAGPGDGTPPADGRYGPLVAAIGLAGMEPQHVSTWLFLVLAGLLGGLAAVSRFLRRTRSAPIT